MRYSNRYDSSKNIKFLDILKWQLFKKRGKKENSILQVKPTPHLLNIEDDFICWLGHASFFIQLDKKRILLDPVFGNIPFYKRYNKSPYSVKMLGRIDYIFISHTHYDHFDTPSIKSLLYKNATFVTPLGMDSYLKKIDSNIKIKTLNWYESIQDDSVKITLTPAKHWGKRGIFDTNRALWGGVVIESKEQTIFFAGDSAYDEHFKRIGKKFNIDFALLPIGAYEPAKIMRNNHLNPKEALRAFRYLNAKKFIPMHYGTFKLSDEGINEPYLWLKKLSNQDVIFLNIGEVKNINEVK